jgi:hypothetical protein
VCTSELVLLRCWRRGAAALLEWCFWALAGFGFWTEADVCWHEEEVVLVPLPEHSVIWIVPGLPELLPELPPPEPLPGLPPANAVALVSHSAVNVARNATCGRQPGRLDLP